MRLFSYADVVLVVEPDEGKERQLTERLVAFNRERSPLWEPNHDARFSAEPLHIFAQDAECRLIGGLVGRTHAIRFWLEIGLMWVDENRRSQGLGRALVERAEEEARRRGCLHARLSTSEHQAPGFYEWLGYTLYGRLEGCPPGETALYYRKDLGGSVRQNRDMNATRPVNDARWRGDALSEDQSARISLESPSETYVDSFFEAMAEFKGEGNPQVSEDITRERFPAYVRRLRDQTAGKNLKEGHVPSKEFWIVDADGYAGRIILGLSFTPGPDRIGNHVGYAVRPTKRRKGYATEALRCLLDEARRLKIHKLMPVCDEENVASRKVIERNGGTLLDRLPNDEVHHGALRFTIDLDAGPDGSST